MNQLTENTRRSALALGVITAGHRSDDHLAHIDVIGLLNGEGNGPGDGLSWSGDSPEALHLLPTAGIRDALG